MNNETTSLTTKIFQFFAVIRNENNCEVEKKILRITCNTCKLKLYRCHHVVVVKQIADHLRLLLYVGVFN